MVKKILIGLLVVATGVGLYLGYQYFVQVKAPTEDPVKAIPVNAALIIRGDNAHELWAELANTNIMWEELQTLQMIAEMDELAARVDSIMQGHDLLSEFLTDNPTAISAHLTGGNVYDFLFAAAIPAGLEQDAVEKAIYDQFVKAGPGPFEGVDVYSALTSHGEFFFIVHEGVFALTWSRVLIEDVVRHMNAGKNIANEPGFSEVMDLGSKDAEANIFINYEYLPALVSTHLNPETKALVKPFVNFANSATFDVTINSNSVMLNGFTYSSDSSLNYLNIFKSQEPQTSNITSLLPQSTAFLLQYRFSNPEQFFMDYRMYLADAGNLQKYEADVAQLNAECGCNLPTYLLTWVGDEISVVATEGNDDHRYGIFKASNVSLAIERLNDLALLVSQKRGVEPVHEWIGDNVVGQIPVDSLHKKLFGHAFSDLNAPYYMAYGDYILFASSMDALNDILRDIKGDRTLLHSESFNAFNENLSGTASLFLYSNTARSPELYKQFVNEENAAAIDSNLTLFRQFEAFAFQIEYYKDDLFLTNAYLKHNPVYKEESSTLWEAALDSVISSKPFIVTDHNTGAKEILIQDSSYTVYLISNTGKVQWTYQLDGPILGDVQQIDAYKNNKLQLLMNTSSTLYLIDRLGRDVEGYPVLLPAAANGAVGVADYENNKNYRLLVPCQNGMVYNYETFGKPVEGWAFGGASASVNTSPVHFNLMGLDYIFFTDEGGEIYLLNRKGEIRHEVPKDIAACAAGSSINLELGRTIDETRVVYTDTTGAVVKLRFNGEVDMIPFLRFSSGHQFVFADVDGDNINDYLFADSTNIWVYGADEQLKFDLSFEEAIEIPLQVYTASDGTGYVGVVLPDKGEVYLFDHTGVLQGDMPFTGNAIQAVADINKDGVYNVVVAGSGKIVYTYNLN